MQCCFSTLHRMHAKLVQVHLEVFFPVLDRETGPLTPPCPLCNLQLLTSRNLVYLQRFLRFLVGQIKQNQCQQQGFLMEEMFLKGGLSEAVQWLVCGQKAVWYSCSNSFFTRVDFEKKKIYIYRFASSICCTSIAALQALCFPVCVWVTAQKSSSCYVKEPDASLAVAMASPASSATLAIRGCHLWGRGCCVEASLGTHLHCCPMTKPGGKMNNQPQIGISAVSWLFCL